MADQEDLDDFEFIRTIAVARILMPKSHVRLSAGRESMNPQMQSLAFMAGANSIFYCDKLLTTSNPKANEDMALFDKLGIEPEPSPVEKDNEQPAAEWHRALTDEENNRFFYNAAG